jgi:hypothetical protein
MKMIVSHCQFWIICMQTAADSGGVSQYQDKFIKLGKQILGHIVWLILFHLLNFHFATSSEKEFTLAVSQSIDDALPKGITKPDDVYTLLEQLRGMQDPNGAMAGSTSLAGGILLRQVRVIRKKCNSDINSAVSEFCAPPYSEADEEQLFKPWSGAELSEDVLKLPEYKWDSASESGDIGSFGIPASGFVIRLASSNETAAAILRMRAHRWLDAKTRAVFVTFCLYNNVANLIVCSRTDVIVGITGLLDISLCCNSCDEVI